MTRTLLINLLSSRDGQVFGGAGGTAAWVPSGVGSGTVHQCLLLVHPAQPPTPGGDRPLVAEGGAGEDRSLVDVAILHTLVVCARVYHVDVI